MASFWKYLLLLVPLVAGFLLPIQGGVNNRLGQALASPFAASFCSFLGGTLVLGTFLIFTKYTLPMDFNFSDVPVVYWIGGLCGAIFVTSVIVVAPKTGMLPFLSLSLLGQFLMAAAIDHKGWLGIVRSDFNLQKLLGISVILLGILLIQTAKAPN